MALRLKRCQLMKQEQEEMSDFGFFGGFGFPTIKPQRLGLDTFKVSYCVHIYCVLNKNCKVLGYLLGLADKALHRIFAIFADFGCKF